MTCLKAPRWSPPRMCVHGKINQSKPEQMNKKNLPITNLMYRNTIFSASGLRIPYNSLPSLLSTNEVMK
jgi:hypothetical protein